MWHPGSYLRTPSAIRRTFWPCLPHWPPAAKVFISRVRSLVCCLRGTQRTVGALDRNPMSHIPSHLPQAQGPVHHPFVIFSLYDGSVHHLGFYFLFSVFRCPTIHQLFKQSEARFTRTPLLHLLVQMARTHPPCPYLFISPYNRGEQLAFP